MSKSRPGSERKAATGCTVAAIIVNWNHGSFLPDCLAALLADGHARLTDGSLEVVVVDNGSTDGSPEWLARHHPAIRLIRFADNLGFSRALNHGIQHTESDFVLSLNPDVVVSPGFLDSLVAGAQINPGARIGMAAPKLLRADAPGMLDSTGLFVDRRKRPYDRGQGELDRGQYQSQTDIFGPCGAAALYRREMLLDLVGTTGSQEYFDEGFFAYCEDADLAWRAQLRGWHCVYVPDAVATHVRGWGDTLRKPGHASKDVFGPRLALRNRHLMTIKNDAVVYTALDLPLILAAELPRIAYAALTAPKILLGLLDLARAWPGALRKRRQIRSQRTVDDAALRHWFTRPSSRRARRRGTEGTGDA